MLNNVLSSQHNQNFLFHPSYLNCFVFSFGVLLDFPPSSAFQIRWEYNLLIYVLFHLSIYHSHKNNVILKLNRPRTRNLWKEREINPVLFPRVTCILEQVGKQKAMLGKMCWNTNALILYGSEGTHNLSYASLTVHNLKPQLSWYMSPLSYSNYF